MVISFLKLVFLQTLFMYTESEILSKQPNIIIILSDDVGWNDFGLHGSSQIPTPNIDALGYNGVILNKFYTQQSCTPSRAALLTGKYPMRLGLQGVPLSAGENRSLPLDTATMPERLKTLGYRTHLVGKWHLGAACEEHTPIGRGFDTHFGYYNGYIGYFSYQISDANPANKNENFTGFDFRNDFTPQWSVRGQYATEVMTKKAVEIIEAHDSTDPLFLMVSHLAGHTGEDGIELGVPNATEANEKYGYITRNERRLYADLINIMDRSVGQVVDSLSKTKLIDNSVILFFSDNGAQTTGQFQNFGSSWPFRGLKFTLFEGGVRGTAVVYSPLFKNKNYINENLIHLTDFLPTFYHAAGGNVEDLGNIDGINQWNVISENLPTERTEILINIDEINGYSGILGYDGKYKLLNGSYENGVYNDYYGDSGQSSADPSYDLQLILNSPTNLAIRKIDGTLPLSETQIQNTRRRLEIGACRSRSELFLCNKMCLFDIYADPCETSNLINETNLQDVVATLKEKYLNYLNEIVPSTNRLVDVNSDPKNFNNTWSPWLSCKNTSNSFVFSLVLAFNLLCISLIKII